MLDVVWNGLEPGHSGTGRMIGLLKRLFAAIRARRTQLALAVRVTVAAF